MMGTLPCHFGQGICGMGLISEYRLRMLMKFYPVSGLVLCKGLPNLTILVLRSRLIFETFGK